MPRVLRARNSRGTSRADSVCRYCSANKRSGAGCTPHRHVFASASDGITSSASAPAPASVAPAPVPYAGTTSRVVGPAPSGKERKKRKRGVSMAEDEIDALFEGALGRKVARSALVVGNSGAAPPLMPSTVLRLPTATGQEKRGDQNADCGPGAVVDPIRAALSGGEGKKRRAQQP